MAFLGSSVAISHTGKVRSNNQDSGYAGSNLFVVADGMGGHAGGDVASSIAINQLRGLDRVYDSAGDAGTTLERTLQSTAKTLIDTVGARPELSGMGTTVSALVMVGDVAVIGHIGDSRVYLFRNEELTQITADHTFVQRLVDSGRITPDEARFHPRRSVLMRVLGDMDANPDIDTIVLPTQPGDRWLLCSDGLSGVVDDAHIVKALAEGHPPARTADALLKDALDGGAPDNVTIVIVDVGGNHPMYADTPTIVGSASTPIGIDVPTARPSRTSWLHPGRQAGNEPSHFEPGEQFLEELIEEDRRRATRRRMAWIIGFILVIIALGIGLFFAYQWTQTRYFVGADEDTVVIYQGIQQDLGPISLSTPYQDTGITLKDLTPFSRNLVERTISADTLDDARTIADRLRNSAEGAP